MLHWQMKLVLAWRGLTLFLQSAGIAVLVYDKDYLL